MKRALSTLIVALCAVVLCATTSAAQVTTGNIVGKVVDQQGGALPGATVVAVHTPTGTNYEAVVGGNGEFQLLNVRVGGPYTVKVSMSGFKDQELKDLNVQLGQNASLSVKLDLASVSTTVNVVANSSAIDLARAGTSASISDAVKETLPTISRSIFDIVRANPYFNQYNTAGNGPSSISVAGRNNRYNNIAIDGAVNNDIFGLAASGTPEGQTGSQPVSLDAIQEIQLLVSPYDVRQGGFSGGGVNAITKGGTNSLKGSAFYFGRSEKFVGKGSTGIAVSKFDDKQYGGSLGGPVKKNKVFFFGSIDSQRQNLPSGVSVDTTGNLFGNKAAVDAIVAQLKTTYGYDPGPNPTSEFIKIQNNDKYFGRMDINLKTGQQLTLRHNFVDAHADTGTPSNTLFLLPDNYVRFNIKTHSSVGQLNSTFSRATNELRVAMTTVRNRRGGQPFEQKAFPNLSITVAPGFTVRAGREVSSTANELDQDNIEINDDLLFVKGRHTFTIGTHNEFFKFRNVFIQNAFGSYTYTSLANFQSGLAQAYNYFYSNTSDPREAARFSVKQLGFYAGDQWRIKPNLTLTYGVRFDVPRFDKTPNANTTAQFLSGSYGYSTDVVPETQQFSPRLGFNWDPNGDGKSQIRGGIGIFAGRTPYVWMSNQYSNTGVDFTRLSISSNANNKIPFIADANSQSKAPTGATVTLGTNDINLIDPAYKYPEMIRGNLAYERELPFGLMGSAEFLFGTVRSDVKYTNINYVQTGTSSLDNRPIYGKKVSTLANVILLSNIDKGNTWSMAYELRRPMKNGWYANASYFYGQSRLPEESQSSVALTSWQNVFSLDQYNPPITRSDFDAGHRVNASASYEFGLGKGIRATISGFYSGQSGKPYSIFYTSTDVNGDGVTFNDLFYMPTGTDGITYTNGSYNDLLTFMQTEKCTKDAAGTVIGRNVCRAPWTNTLDGRFAVALPFKKVKAEITLDMLNLINFFDSKGGQVRYLNFNSLAVFAPTVTAGRVTNINLATINNPTFSRYLRDDLRSRWQMQLGGRIRF